MGFGGRVCGFYFGNGGVLLEALLLMVCDALGEAYKVSAATSRQHRELK